MAFQVPTFAQTFALLLADYANRFPGDNISRRSDNARRVANQALGVTSLHHHIRQVGLGAMPDTATGEDFLRHMAIYGLSLTPATVAYKAGALRVTGDVSAPFTDGDQLSSVDGLIFELGESGVVGAGGYTDVAIRAVTVGSAGRKSKDTSLTFLSAPSGIDATAELVLDMDEGGADLETEDHARVRLLDKIAEPNMGGNANDFRQWAKELAGITEAYVYPLRNGLGSVHLAALKIGSGAVRALSSDERDDLQDYIDAKRPVGYWDFRVLETVPQPEDIELEVEPEADSAYEFDWVDSGGPLEVAAWNGTTRAMQFTADRPAGMAVGHRIVLKGASNDGHEYEIEGLSSTDSIVLAEDDELATAVPAAGELVYAGGPLVAPTRAAMLAHVDNLGTGRQDTLNTDRDYSAGSSYWEGALRTGKLRTVAQQVTGVLDTRLPTPAANVYPTNEAPASTVSYITPGQVIVRRAW